MRAYLRQLSALFRFVSYKLVGLSAAAALIAAVTMSPGLAQKKHVFDGNAPVPDKPELGSLGAKINANTIAIVSGNINAAWLTLAYDLSAVLDDGNDFRVLPVIGKGGAQNVRDVRYLKGIDLGITVTSVLGKFRRSGELGDISDKIDYITKLSDDEMHVLVRADSGITALDQLNGKKVNFSDMGSATEVSAGDVFERLGIKPIEVNMGQADAYEKMKTGEIAATIQFGAKPAPAVAKLKASDGIRLLAVPYDQRLQQDYLPATLTNKDYPGIIGNGASVDTIAYGAVMICYNWPKGSDRYQRIANFVDRFFAHFAEFQKPPRHPTWREVNLAADLPGWKRFPEAQTWLDDHRPPAPEASVQQTDFDQFLAQRAGGVPDLSTPARRDELFRQFLQWDQERSHTQKTGG
jgi:TRAP transporter TAXI family solute receptor